MTRTATTYARVSWTAPTTGPALGGYEVFYQTAAGSNGSSTTTTTELTLTGLMAGNTYFIFVVAFGSEGAPVFPSTHSNIEIIKLGELILDHMILEVCEILRNFVVIDKNNYFCHKGNKTSKTERLVLFFTTCSLQNLNPLSST